jgi:hypothetical protein
MTSNKSYDEKRKLERYLSSRSSIVVLFAESFCRFSVSVLSGLRPRQEHMECKGVRDVRTV